MTRPDSPGGGFPPAIFIVAFLLVAAGGAEAAPPAPITVDIGVVVASNQGRAIDPALSSLRPKLQSMFNYSSYRMLDRMRRTLAVGETGDFGLPGGRSIRVTPVPAPEGKVRLAVQMMEGSRNLLTTTLGLSRGGMVLLGGAAHPPGVLILLVSAE